jgi:hypothetical protein
MRIKHLVIISLLKNVLVTIDIIFAILYYNPMPIEYCSIKSGGGTGPMKPGNLR